MPPARVVFDANVVISGIVFGGRPRPCLRLADSGLVASITTDAIVADVVDKLINRSGFTRDRADEAARYVHSFSDVVAVSGQIAGVCRDPDDDHILDCAASGSAAFVVTGDKSAHLAVLRVRQSRWHSRQRGNPSTRRVLGATCPWAARILICNSLYDKSLQQIR